MNTTIDTNTRGEITINGRAVYPFMDVRSVLEIAEEQFGDYRGDRVSIILNTDGNAAHVGVIIAGYGSCSGCDAYEAACEEGPAAVAALAREWIGGATYFTSIHDIAHYLVSGPNAALKWYFHERGFRDAVSRLLATLHAVLPGFPVGGTGNAEDYTSGRELTGRPALES